MTAGSSLADTSVTPAVPDDATLVHGAVAGDPRALAAIYDRYAGRLLAFCQSMLRRQGEAEQSLRAIFVTAADRLRELRDPTLLRAWLFAVARDDCQARLEARALEPVPANPVEAAPAETDPADPDASMDLFDEPVADGGPAYSDQLPLELADRQQLADYEVAAAIGVPRSAGAPIIARARKAARRSGTSPLGEGRAFAPEMVALRTDILALAVRPPVAGPASGWIDGWPPTDAMFADAGRPRRWGAPLAVAVVLLLALGAVLGLMSVTGGGQSKARTNVVDTAPPSSAGPVASVTSSAPSSASVTPTDSAPASAIAVQPPTPSAPSSTATTPSSTATAFTVIVSTSLRSINISSGRAQAGCPLNTTCSFNVSPGAVVTIADSNSGRVNFGADRFSAPPSCVGQTGSCTFTVNSNLQIKLTTTVAAPGRNN